MCLLCMNEEGKLIKAVVLLLPQLAAEPQSVIEVHFLLLKFHPKRNADLHAMTEEDYRFICLQFQGKGAK